VDELLLKWFRRARDEKIPIREEMLFLIAEQFARICGYGNVGKLDRN